MIPELRHTRYFLCPSCNQCKFEVEHLMNEDVSFGPWYCKTNNCDCVVRGQVQDGKITVEQSTRMRDQFPTLSLLKFRDIYLIVNDDVIGDQNGHIDHWDYFFHSHQCPENLFRSVAHVFDGQEGDPHGIMRFVASIPGTDDNHSKIDGICTTHDLLALFKTDGEPLPSEWPAENKGVIEWIAQLRKSREH